MLKMTSYIKLFEDFLQKKDSDVQKDSTADENIENTENSSTTETVPSPKSNLTLSPTPPRKMEHSYIRDSTNCKPMTEMSNGLPPARTILVRRPPQCPSCHTHPLEEHDFEDGHQAVVPAYNEIGAKESMNECARIAKYVKNNNPDDEDWEGKVNQTGWSNLQKTVFEKVSRILDDDQLGRLANTNRQHEAMHRRAIVDKSAARMRKLFASISWESRLTQWLHCLLMESLPPSYMASYLDILQTLKTKVPILMDKMLFGRPLNVSQELLAPVMKKKWEPQFNTKAHKLQQNAVIVALPSMPTSGAIPSRLQKWYQQLASITQIVQITLPMINNHTNQQPLEQIAEQIVSLTRVKIQELRNENPMRSIILIGFNAGAALAIQVAMSETVSCVVCMGFAYNTIKGVRGTPEDRILDLKVPVIFVIGQNSARSSQEEIESLREKMQSETALVVVGSADDYLRVPKSRREIENCTQSMVDAMVVDEVYEFIKKILANPPGPRVPTSVTGSQNVKHTVRNVTIGGEKHVTPLQRKRKQDSNQDADLPMKSKFTGNVGRPRTRPLPTAIPGTIKLKHQNNTTVGNLSAKLPTANTSNEDLNMAMQSLLGDTNNEGGEDMATTTGASAAPSNRSTSDTNAKLLTNYELVSPTKAGTLLNKSGILSTGATASGVAGTKIKMIPSNQFLQIKPQPLQTQSKIYTIKATSSPSSASSSSSANINQGPTSIGSIVRTSSNLATTGQQQIFTLRSPNGKTTQFVTAAPCNAPQKYTMLKNVTSGTMLQLTTAKPVPVTNSSNESTTGEAATSTGSSRMDLSNIIDMPIIFADNDGNLTDSSPSTAASASANEESIKSPLIVNKPSTSSGVGQLIISQKIIKEANQGTLPTAIGTTKGGAYVINKSSGQIITAQQLQGLSSSSSNNKTPSTAATGGVSGGSKKVVFINRNTMKPCPNIIARSNLAQNVTKYAKVVVSNSKTAAPSLVTRTPGATVGGVQISSGGNGSSSGGSNTNSPSTLSSPSSIVSNVRHLNLQTLKTSLNLSGGNGSVATNRSPLAIGGSGASVNAGSSIISLAGKPLQIINKSVSGSTLAVTSGTPSSVTTTSDKPTIIRNIVVKPGNLKQIPPHLTSQLINRNLTVRKLVNFIPSGSGGIVTTESASLSALTTNSDGSISSQASPITVSATNVGGGGSASSSSSSSSMQTTPKVITLNPLNTTSNLQSKTD